MVGIVSQKFIYRKRPDGASATKGKVPAAIALAACTLLLCGSMAIPVAPSAELGGRTLLNVDSPRLCNAKTDNATRIVLGSIIAWFSGLLYFCSRIPQIVHMIRMKNLDGLEVSMFSLAVAGNTFCGIQFISDAAINGIPSVSRWCADTLPFIIGSSGTLVFDVIILYLFAKHGRATKVSKSDLESQY